MLTGSHVNFKITLLFKIFKINDKTSNINNLEMQHFKLVCSYLMVLLKNYNAVILFFLFCYF